MILVGIGLLFWAAGAFVFWQSPLYSKKAVKLNAVVVDIKHENSTSDGHTRTLYAPVLQYQYNNRNIKAVSSVYSNYMPVMGETSEIKIMPDNPEKPVEMSIFNYILPWLLIAIGVILLFLKPTEWTREPAE